MNFWNCLEQYGERTALFTERDTVCYRSLAEISDAIADNVDERSLVFLICKNRVASLAGYLGFLRKKIVPVLLNHTADKALFDKQMQIYRPQYLWCPDDFVSEPDIYRYDGYKLVSTGYDRPNMDDNLALMIPTSGSTGSPKLVRLSYNNLQSNTDAIVSFLGITPEDRAITSLPMSYVYGLSVLQTHLAVGAAVILTEKTCFEKGFWDSFRQHGATTFSAVPYVYQMLDKLSFWKLDLPSLRYATQAGGKLGEDLHRKLANGLSEKGKRFIVMYGASEATARMSYVPGEMAVEKAGSIGLAIPGGRLERIDANGAVITDDDTVGELVYYGENVMLGYALSRDDLALGDEMHGRLETGDLARKDKDGYYYLVGRKNRFLKLFGNRVSLDEMEGILASVGYEAVCAGADENMRVYTTSNANEEIVALLCDKTGLDRMAFSVIRVDEIPRNDAGKVLYAALE